MNCGAPGGAQRGGPGAVPSVERTGEIEGNTPYPWVSGGTTHIKSGRDYERGGGVEVRLGNDTGRKGVGRGSFGAGGRNAPTL